MANNTPSPIGKGGGGGVGGVGSSPVFNLAPGAGARHSPLKDPFSSNTPQDLHHRPSAQHLRPPGDSKTQPLPIGPPGPGSSSTVPTSSPAGSHQVHARSISNPTPSYLSTPSSHPPSEHGKSLVPAPLSQPPTAFGPGLTHAASASNMSQALAQAQAQANSTPTSASTPNSHASHPHLTQHEQPPRSSSPGEPTESSAPTTDAIDQVIASAMALAGNIPQGVVKPPVGPPIQHRSITPSGFHPAAVGVDGRVNLFVGNLPYRVRWQDVKDLFRRAGTVLRADVSLDPATNRSKGHGTVLMGSREDGVKAIEMFNGYNWQTRTLEVRPDRLPPEYEPQPHVHHLPPHHQSSGPFSHHHPMMPYHPPGQGGQSGMYPGPQSMGQGGMDHSAGIYGSPGRGPFGGNPHLLTSSYSAPGAGGGGQSNYPSNHNLIPWPRDPSSPAKTSASPRPFYAMPAAAPESVRSSSPFGQIIPKEDPRLARGSFSASSRAHLVASVGSGVKRTSSTSPFSEKIGLPHLAESRTSTSTSSDDRNAAVGMGNLLDRRGSSGLHPPVGGSTASDGLSLSPGLARRAPPPGSLGPLPPNAFAVAQQHPSQSHPPFPSGLDFSPVRGTGASPGHDVRYENGLGMGQDHGGSGFGYSNGGPGGNGSGPGSGGRLLYVGNLPFQVQWQEIKDLFRTVGNVIRADIALGPDKRSRGFGTVLFSSESYAAAAVAKFDGMEWNGRKLKVRQDRGPSGNNPQQYPHPPGPMEQQAYHSPPLQTHNMDPYAVGLQQHNNTYMPNQDMYGSHPGSPLGHLPPMLFSPPPPMHRQLSTGEVTTFSDEGGYQFDEGADQSADVLTQTPPHVSDAHADAQSYEAPGPSNDATGGNVGDFNRPRPLRPNGPPHPGRIVMPSYSSFGNPLSPIQTRGLPPMTPSMPGYTFHAYPSTPPLHPLSYLSPGLGPFSPGLPLNSPPAYHFNPFMSAAPGGPVNMQPSSTTPTNQYPMYQSGQRPSAQISQTLGSIAEPEYFPRMGNSAMGQSGLFGPMDRVQPSGQMTPGVPFEGEESGGVGGDVLSGQMEGLALNTGVNQGTSSIRASFDGSRPDSLSAGLSIDQRRASMDDTVKNADSDLGV